MPCPSVMIRCCRLVATAVPLLLATRAVDVQAATVTVQLDAEADLTSHFIAYWSEAIAQLDLTYPNTTRQPFWNTNDLTQTYNSNFDFFPNDSAMKFGVLTYDDSSLISGNGSTEITGLTLGIEKDPLDPSYVNGSWLSFSTDLENYSGAVTVVNGEVTDITLAASYTSTGSFGSASIDGSGTFTVAGDQFEVLASAYNPGLGAFDPSMEWNWTGKILNLTQPPVADDADFNSDGVVDAIDYALWREALGATGEPSYATGDANGDGQVTTADFQIWQAQYGGPPPLGFSPTIAPVPEPASTAIAILAALGLGLRRKFTPQDWLA